MWRGGKLTAASARDQTPQNMARSVGPRCRIAFPVRQQEKTAQVGIAHKRL